MDGPGDTFMLCKISQTWTNTGCSHLYVESKMVELIKADSRIMVARGWI